MNRILAAIAAPLFSLALVAGAVSMQGCGDDPTECSEEIACGFGEVCIEGTCQGKTCSTSADCNMEYTCDGGECTPGCASNDDCYPGDACNTETNTCEPAGCRTTTLDCGFGEFCNQATGDCYEASGYYCKDCQGDDDCGGNGNVCFGFGAYGDFCGVTCDSEGDCPSGYTCIDFTGTGDKHCITYCWLYITDDAKGPPSPAMGQVGGGLDMPAIPEPGVCESEVTL